MLSRRFKQLERPILFGITVLIALSFGITYQMSYVAAGKREDKAGKIFGQEISLAEFLATRARWKALESMNPYTAGRTSDERLDAQTWNVLIHLHHAQDAGLKVSPEEVREGVKMMFSARHGPSFDYDEYARTVGNLGISTEEFEKAIAEALLLQKLQISALSSYQVSQKDIFGEYVKQSEEARARFVAFRPKDLEKKVAAPDGDEIAKHFNKNRARYGTPKRIQLEYVIAAYDELKKQATEPTEDQIKEYYEKNKDSLYKVPAAAPEKSEPKDAQPNPNPNPNPPAPAPAPAPAGPKYLPLAEMKSNVIDRLKDNQARLKAVELTEELDRRISSELRRLEGEPVIDMEKLAKELGLHYEVTAFLTPRNLSELTKAVGYSQQLPRSLEALAEKMFTGVLSSEKGRFKLRAVKVMPEDKSPRLTDAVRDAVVRDLREEKSRTLAQSESDKFENTLKERVTKALEEAKVKEMQDRARAEQIVRETNRKLFERVAEEAHLKIEETGFFRRDGYVATLKGQGQMFTRAAFDLTLEGFTHAAEMDGNWYVLQTLERRPPSGADYETKREEIRANLLQRKRQEFYLAWDKSIKDDAKLEDYRAQAKKGNAPPGGAPEPEGPSPLDDSY